MKQGYYLHIDNPRGNGLTNKFQMQIKAFNESLVIRECPLRTVKKPLLVRLTNILPFSSYSRDYEEVLRELTTPDFVYIRMIYPDKKYFSFLAAIKERFPQCKILCEIPTYPYKKEWCSSLYGKCMYLKELILRRDYKKLIDRFVTYSYDDSINGVKTIQTMNGVDVESFTPVSGERPYDPNHITLIAVAFLMRHHGYERIIEGLGQYYRIGRDRTVNVCIIGKGKEKKRYEKLIRKYELFEYVKLLDPMYGKDLDGLYNTADAGLSGFGFYKDGVDQVGTLKTREYLAKGLPVILGTEDRLFSANGYDYGLLFPNNDSPIDFEKIICFLDNLYLNRDKSEVVDKIREFAKRTVDNRMTLAPIVDYIKNGDS